MYICKGLYRVRSPKNSLGKTRLARFLGKKKSVQQNLLKHINIKYVLYIS